jgi:leucyl aminopeptidase
VEIVNTDAEGRLILSDALCMALDYKPRAVIDIATLTGACVVALGKKCAGIMSTDESLVRDVLEASRAAGENIWRLPLLEEYEELLKSETADFKHVGTRWGGAITAALFLKKFVSTTPWAHLDIAGPARFEKATPDTPEGGSGFGVHTLIKYLKGL